MTKNKAIEEAENVFEKDKIVVDDNKKAEIKDPLTEAEIKDPLTEEIKDLVMYDRESDEVEEYENV